MQRFNNLEVTIVILQPRFRGGGGLLHLERFQKLGREISFTEIFILH